jgi:hypothetical protein
MRPIRVTAKKKLKEEIPRSLLAVPTVDKESCRRVNSHVKMKAYDKYVSFLEKAVLFQQSMPYVTVMMERWIKKKRRRRYSPCCVYPRKQNGKLVWSVEYPFQLKILREIVEINSTEEIPIQILKRECSCQREDSFSFCRLHGAVLNMGGTIVSFFCGPYVKDEIHIPEATPILCTEPSHVFQYIDTRAHFFSWPNILPVDCSSLGYRCDQNDILLCCQSPKGSNVVNGYLGTSAFQEWNLPIDLFMVIPNVIREISLFQNVLFWILTIENRLSRQEIERMREGWGESAKVLKENLPRPQAFVPIYMPTFEEVLSRAGIQPILKVESSSIARSEREDPVLKKKKMKYLKKKEAKSSILNFFPPPPQYMCKVCLTWKIGANFSVSQKRKGGLRTCKNCVKELLRSNHAADPPQKN